VRGDIKVPLPCIDDGWLLVECGANSRTPVWISVDDDEFVAAFRDWFRGRRVAKIRPPNMAGSVSLRLRVGEHVVPAGTITV
jgi:hypothetical protein